MFYISFGQSDLTLTSSTTVAYSLDQVSSNRCLDYRISNNSDLIDISCVKLEMDAKFSHVKLLDFSFPASKVKGEQSIAIKLSS